MKLLYTSLLLLLGVAGAQAQSFEITSTGTAQTVISGAIPFDSTVQRNVPFTLNIDVSDATVGTILNAGAIAYLSGSGDSSFSVGDFTVNSSAITRVQTQVDSNESGVWGYQFTFTLGANNGFASGSLTLDLQGTNPAVAPSTSLSSVGQFPLSDFNFTNFMRLDESTGVSGQSDSFVMGGLTSYQYTAVAAPEPSAWGLFMFGASVVAFRMRTIKRTSAK